MPRITRIIMVCALLVSSGSYAQLNIPENPLLVHSNTPIPYNKITASIITQAVASIIASSDERIHRLSSISEGKNTKLNTLMAYDELQYEIGDLAQKLALIEATFENDSIRNSAIAQNKALNSYISRILLKDSLYISLKRYASSADANQLSQPEKKYMTETIAYLEKAGMKLPKDKRDELEEINNKIINLGSLFDQNIAESKDSVIYTIEELQGVPAIKTNAWKRADNTFVVNVNGPNYLDISEYAEKSDTRKAMYIRYNNRAYPGNIQVLDSLFYYRQVLADKLGFRSYATYALVDKMAGSPSAVWTFSNNLVEKLTPRVTEELKELTALKARLHPEETDTLYAWDVNFYKKKYLDENYNLNGDELKAYFEIDNTIKGMFTVYEKLFNIRVRETSGHPVWHEKVRSFELLKDGKKAGSFYFDLYPRPNKYTHFACAPMSQYRLSDGKEVLPVASLICNFPEGSKDGPSLLNHQQVITLFHEFGHLVHILLGRSAIASQGSFAVKGDFVEAPSQFLENWCWEYPSIKILARHYKTGAEIPKSLFDKLKSTQSVNLATYYIRQLYYGLLDFTYEDKYREMAPTGIQTVSKNLHAMLQMPYPEGSNFIASFGHLNGYAANYYGYLWSRVFAQDMFSVFKQHGVMDTKTGIRYRKTILERASTVPEMDLLRDFLGREPNAEAFLQSLGIRE